MWAKDTGRRSESNRWSSLMKINSHLFSVFIRVTDQHKMKPSYCCKINSLQAELMYVDPTWNWYHPQYSRIFSPLTRSSFSIMAREALYKEQKSWAAVQFLSSSEKKKHFPWYPIQPGGHGRFPCWEGAGSDLQSSVFRVALFANNTKGEKRSWSNKHCPQLIEHKWAWGIQLVLDLWP